MKKNKYEFLKNMAQLTKGEIVICEDGKAYHTIIKMDLNAVKMWNDSHKTKLFVNENSDGKYYDIDAYDYNHCFTDEYFFRKGDADLLERIAKKYDLETYTVKYKKVDTFGKHWERYNNSQKNFNIYKYYESKKKELQQKGQEIRNAKAFESFKKNIKIELDLLSNKIIASFSVNITNDDFYYNYVMADIKKMYIKANKKYIKMCMGELKPNPSQLLNYTALIDQLLMAISKYNITCELEDGAKEKQIAKACYYSSKNNCNWEDAENTNKLILKVVQE